MVEERNEADGGACWSDGLMRHDLVFVGCVVVCMEEINFMFFVAFLWQTIGPFTQDCRWVLPSVIWNLLCFDLSLVKSNVHLG